MTLGRVKPQQLPTCPGRDSRFTIRHNSNEQGNPWWVFYESPAGQLIPSDHSHAELVELVNDLKEQMGNAPGGSFSINEHGQVIARTSADAGHGGNAIHLIGVSRGQVQTYATPICFRQGVLDPTVVLQEGEPWLGPLCGMTYSFAAPGNPKPPSRNLDEVFVEIEGTIHQLSSDAHIRPYPPATGSLADCLRALRRQLPSGGRFRVNEHGRSFTSNSNLFIGCIPIDQWFPPLTARS